MRALVFDLSLAKVVGARLLKRPSLLVRGPLSGLRIADVPEPPLPAPTWVRVGVDSCGLCGSDLAVIAYKASPALSPWSSFPCVLGHEVLGRIVEVGASVRSLAPGMRVAIDPFLGCLARDVEPCAACAGDLHALCERQVDGPLPGMLMGMTRSVPGGFSERVVAHQSQIVVVPDALDGDVAALLEPLSVGLHAVLRRPPRDGDKVLVIGGGAIALVTIAAIRLAGLAADVTASVRTGAQAELATALGRRARSVRAGRSSRRSSRGKRCAPAPSDPGPACGGRGFSLVLDCVGGKESLQLALRFVRPRGAVTLVGNAGELPRVDFSFLWAKEAELVGTLAYGGEHVGARRVRTFELCAERAAASPLPLGRIVSERRPLLDYATVVARNFDRDRTGVFKSLLLPGAP
ncbi:MAG: alcohol dehydrogenase catalytic domain-containing protein [Acidobacteriota bacterium]